MNAPLQQSLTNRQASVPESVSEIPVITKNKKHRAIEHPFGILVKDSAIPESNQCPVLASLAAQWSLTDRQSLYPPICSANAPRNHQKTSPNGAMIKKGRLAAKEQGVSVWKCTSISADSMRFFHNTSQHEPGIKTFPPSQPRADQLISSRRLPQESNGFSNPVGSEVHVTGFLRQKNQVPCHQAPGLILLKMTTTIVVGIAIDF